MLALGAALILTGMTPAVVQVRSAPAAVSFAAALWSRQALVTSND